MTDTGPPYPRGVGAPNGIGEFQIGVSPIGTLSTFDEWSTVISQHANSPTIDAMVTSFNAATDQTQNMETLFDVLWNIATAQGHGLDVLGRIVGVGRTLLLPGDSNLFGFQEAGSWTGFGQGGFFSGSGPSNNFVLADPDYRTLIYAKAAGNISDGAIPSINRILLTLFPRRGTCYVADNLDMSMTYTFLFPLSTVELAILQLSGVLPNPAGVVINIVQH